MTISLEPIERGRLVDEVLQRLEAMITGMPAGARLPTERELCEQLGVSRTSVRSAMQRLAERGAVSVEVGRGTFVRLPDTQRLAEQLGLLIKLDRDSYWRITEARRIVETQIAGLAAARRTFEQLSPMTAALHDMDGSMDDPDRFAVGDERFHLAIADAADNEILGVFAQQMQAMIRTARHEIFSVIEISPRAQEYHWEIFGAIERQSPGEAMAASARHLDEMERYVRLMLAARGDPSETRGAD